MTDPGVMKLRPYWQYDAKSTTPTPARVTSRWTAGLPGRQRGMEHMVPAERVPMPLHGQDASKRQVEAGAQGGADSAGRGLMPDPHFSTNPAKVRLSPT